MDIHTNMMNLALEQAKIAQKKGEVPVGAIVYTKDGTIIAKGHNEVLTQKNPTAHAEFLACNRACNKLQNTYLEDCFVTVTLEPCAMCAQALSWFRVKEIRFGAYDVKSGGTENGARVLQHAHWKPKVYGGLLEKECSTLLQDFFKNKR